ncbi:MAG: hypothetical protein EPN84_10745 [Legionella sp.]|nr:MAG: hypothetical protein EPN84_10745 [Legionella sp.]
MKTYFLSYVVTDQKVESNVFWHSCVFLSEMDDEKNEIKVLRTWSFYGIPSTTENNAVVKYLKSKVGLKLDLAGNHGWFTEEVYRFLDLGVGIHGVNFEVSEANLWKTDSLFQNKVRDQIAATEEAAKALNLKPQGKWKRYPCDDHSAEIFEYEKKKAKEEGRESRLQPFDLSPSLGWTGPHFYDASTCKSQIMDILSQVLTEKQIARLTVHPTIPRWSGPMEDLYWETRGPIEEHTKSSGEIVLSRNGTNPAVGLYALLPFQEVEASPEIINRFRIEEPYCGQIKKQISQLKQLEWLFRNTKMSEPLKGTRDQLVEKIVGYSRAFFDISHKANPPSDEEQSSFVYSFFYNSETPQQKKLSDKIKEVGQFLDSLYTGAVEHWDMNWLYPFNQIGKTPTPADDPVKLLLCALPKDKKHKLCEILERHYFEPQHEAESQVEQEGFHM